MGNEVRKRLRWVQLFESLKNYTQVCLKCGISRPTLRKWVSRYREQGVDGLIGKSKRPLTSPATRITNREREWIAELRTAGWVHVGSESELERCQGFEVSRTTIGKVLKTFGPPALRRPLGRKGTKRYAKEVPGERVQMDTCKIAPGLYQYTAVDDCTRMRVLATFHRRTAANSLRFLELVIEEFPFPIQRIQTDRGREFFAYCFQEKLMEYGIKFRPIRPASPHLNGKVERSQRTDLEEFYPTVNLKSPDLSQQLQDWQDHYNQYRPHGRYKVERHGRPGWTSWQ